MYHVNVNVNLMVENVIQIKSGIMINVDASAKNIYVKKIILGIILHAVAKMVNIQQLLLKFSDYVLQNYRRRRYHNYSKKYNLGNKTFLYFTCLFINHHYIINGC